MSSRRQTERSRENPGNPDRIKRKSRLPWSRVRGTCDPATLPADNTDGLTPLDGKIVGQQRALRALELATRVQERDYNVFVSGPARAGKTFLVTSYLGKVAQDLPTPRDWVYVHNFQDLDSPRALWLPAGRARAFKKELEALVRDIRKVVKRRVAEEVLVPRFKEMEGRYGDAPPVRAHLEDMREDILARVEELDPWEETEGPDEGATQLLSERYQVNLFVDHANGAGAPVVMEPNPTYANLFGKVERRAEMGVLVTDLSLMRAGAVHRANGGFLVLQAADLLQWPLAWDALKRALRLGEAKIEESGEPLGVVSTKGLSPDPIPLSCRVILIGSPALHQMLYTYDDQYRKTFKVKADLDDQMPREPEEVEAFCRYLSTVCRKWGLLPLDRTGMARLVEYGSELAGRQDKLTLQLSEVEDLLREAHIWARDAGSPRIQSSHVEQAFQEKTRRSNLVEEKVQEMMAQGVLKIDTRGEAIGVVNGLSVYDLGDHIFARPTRVTATVSLGRDGVLDIEREAKLGGNIHTKGILILTGYLRARYAQDKPLSLSASLCFEQSYEDVEGDSASGAELCALLSSLAFLPVQQGLAVTGAVSQHGELLPVGDVTRKIEGFYQICKMQGLTGRQGVIIPRRNIPELMLGPEVVEAVRRRRFHVHAVETIEEAMVILTKTPAGELLEDGTYEADTFNDRIDRTLRHLNDLYREYGPDDGGGE